jgi:hypothetical protein
MHTVAGMTSQGDDDDEALNAELTSCMNFGGGFLPKSGGASEEPPQHRSKKDVRAAVHKGLFLNGSQVTDR